MVKKSTMFLALWASIATAAAQPPRAPSYDSFYKNCYGDGAPDQIIASCTAVISQGLVDSDDLVAAYKNRGNAYDDKGRYDQALEDYGRAIAINPQDADCFNDRGTTYMAVESYELAIQDFDRAVGLNPASPAPLSNRCFAKAALGKLEEALTDCNEALSVQPRHPAAYASRGFVHLKLKRFEAAIADYSSELQSRPADPYALFGRGIARYMKGDLRGGDGDIVAAQSLRSDIADHMAKLGVSLRDLR